MKQVWTAEWRCEPYAHGIIAVCDSQENADEAAKLWIDAERTRIADGVVFMGDKNVTMRWTVVLEHQLNKTIPLYRGEVKQRSVEL